jgi:hypothetical protein
MHLIIYHNFHASNEFDKVRFSVGNLIQGASNFLQEGYRAEAIKNNLLQVLHCACWISLAEYEGLLMPLIFCYIEVQMIVFV